MNKSEECDKKLQHSCKEPNEGMGKENNAHECNISKKESHDLEAHDGGITACKSGLSVKK
jgi:hypothetical protein